MTHATHLPPSPPAAATVDGGLFGWDRIPGIVSVWADRSGHARIWQRRDGQLHCTSARFRPWLFATSLADVAHLGRALRAADTADAARAAVTYQRLDGPATGTYPYLLSAADGRALERAILIGAARRLRHAVRLADLGGPTIASARSSNTSWRRARAAFAAWPTPISTGSSPTSKRPLSIRSRAASSSSPSAIRTGTAVLEAPTAAEEAATSRHLFTRLTYIKAGQ